MWNSIVTLIFSVLDCKYPFGGNLVQKKQNYHFELKFGTDSNLNMRNSMVMLIFFCFIPKKPFWVKFGPKNQNCHFELKFGT